MSLHFSAVRVAKIGKKIVEPSKEEESHDLGYVEPGFATYSWEASTGHYDNDGSAKAKFKKHKHAILVAKTEIFSCLGLPWVANGGYHPKPIGEK